MASRDITYIYSRDRMTLFNYDKYDMCKLHQSRKKDVLMDVLPVDICCKVGEYFGCWRREEIKEKEKHYSMYYAGKPNNYHTKNKHYNCYFSDCIKHHC